MSSEHVLDKKINYLRYNGFVVTDNDCQPYSYDLNLALPNLNDIKKLKLNIIKYSLNNITLKSLINISDEYWNNHYFFINTFNKEKNMYDTYGLDSWIYHFINNIYPDTNDDTTLKYPYLIGFEMNQNLLITPLNLEFIGENKFLVKQIIIEKNYKWAIDNEKIKEIIDLLNQQNNNNNNNYTYFDANVKFDNSYCFCCSNFIKNLINIEKSSYRCDYSESNLNTIHNKYCFLHYYYLKNNKDEYDFFKKYGSSKWISFLENKYNPHYINLLNKTPNDYNLELFDLINLIQE